MLSGAVIIRKHQRSVILSAVQVHFTMITNNSWMLTARQGWKGVIYILKPRLVKQSDPQENLSLAVWDGTESSSSCAGTTQANKATKASENYSATHYVGLKSYTCSGVNMRPLISQALDLTTCHRGDGYTNCTMCCPTSCRGSDLAANRKISAASVWHLKVFHYTSK